MGPLRDVLSRDAGGFVEWGIASRCMPGETVLGDRAFVKEFATGALVGAIDGLGHGADAAAAADSAVHTLEQHADEAVEALIQRCHRALLGSRGAAVSIGSVNARNDTLTWVAVGNVEAVTIPFSRDIERHHVIPSPGIVGYKLPNLVLSSVALNKGDLIVFASDGVSPDFPQTLRPVGAARRIAQRVLTSYAKGNDDALVLVVRYLGGQT